jgi:dimethylaniline monooxygenase (N-oxide forming)
MKKEGLTPARYISGRTIHNYLNDFARDQGLVERIQLDTKVVKVERRLAAKNKAAGWRITTTRTGGAPALLDAAKLIVASGVTSEPYVPDFPRARFTKPIIHSSELGTRLDALRAGTTQRAVVLGAAKSAYDTVFHLLKSGKRVDWVIREDGTGPLAIAPPKLLGLFNSVDLMATRILGALSPAILQTEGFWYWFLQRSTPGRAFTHVFWRNLSRVAENHADYNRTDNSRKLTPVPLDYA